jgi:hypothetical protein
VKGSPEIGFPLREIAGCYTLPAPFPTAILSEKAMRTVPLLAAVVGILLGSSAPARAQDSGQPYALQKDSEFDYGCFGPCACPVLVRNGVSGGFLLRPRGPDGLFFDYDVLDVRWMIPGQPDSLPVTGYGTYRVGGEFANQEQLTLNLAIGDGAPRIYDSGVVAKANEFPTIDLEIAASGFSCFDTVFVVRADPRAVAGAGSPAAWKFGIVAVRPNPIVAGAAVEFVTAERAAVDLVLFDSRGRRVATFLATTVMDAGPHHVSWSGSGDTSAPIPPGVYWLELRAPPRRSTSRVTLLSAGSKPRSSFSSP